MVLSSPPEAEVKKARILAVFEAFALAMPHRQKK
jgi:hypothetical protein